MPVTYKQIAEMLGVSRGTVDRALNDRGRVDPEVQKRIQQVAKELGFTPSHVGRALARARNPVKIGVVIHLTKTPFFRQVMLGVEQARTEIGNLGGELLIEEIPSLDAEMQIKAFKALIEQGIQGLAISPVHNEALKAEINGLCETRKLPIVTFNTDFAELNRMCYVGLDNARAGRTAAGLMNLLLKEKSGRVLLISGYKDNPAHVLRIRAFTEEVEGRFPYIDVSGGCSYSQDDDDVAYGIVMDAAKEISKPDAVYVASGGQIGVCRALVDSGMAGKLKVILYDALPDTVEYLKKGVIDFIIDQNAFEQGNRPPHILFNYLFNGQQVEEENIFTDISIKTKYNI